MSGNDIDNTELAKWDPGFTELAMSGYMIGAGVALIGVTMLSADLLWRRIGSKIAPYFWISPESGSAGGGTGALISGANFATVAVSPLLSGSAASAPFQAARAAACCPATHSASPQCAPTSPSCWRSAPSSGISTTAGMPAMARRGGPGGSRRPA